MITTVTTTTTTTVTTVAGANLFAGLGLLATLMLIALLITKELVGAGTRYVDGTGQLTLCGAADRFLDTAITPLLIVFGFIVVVKVIEVIH